MKGPLESRHTSSERSAPGSSSHPGAHRERVLSSPQVVHHTRSGRLTSATHLSEHAVSVLTLRLAHVRGHSEIDGLRGAAAMRETDTPHVERTSCAYPRGHRATTSSQSTRAKATRALYAPLRPANRRAHRPVASARFIACIAAATKAHRNHGDPSLVIRP